MPSAITHWLRICGCFIFACSAAIANDPTTLKSPAVFVYCSAAQEQSLDLLHLNSETGVVAKVARLTLPGEPGALTTSPDGRLLFAAMRSTGRLAAFRIDRATGMLTAINEVAAGADPAQISVDHSGRFLLTAYYVAGKVSVHRIGDDGSLSQTPEQEILTADKAHAIVPDASNRFAFVAHTGPNTIFQFSWDAETGRLASHPQTRLDRPAQTGPRHIAWHPAKAIAYIDNEQANSVTAYRMSASGMLQPGRSVSTLPADFAGANSTAEIKVHPNGRFVYVSNRGHDSLAVIRLDDTGEQLNFVATEPTEKTPRSFDLTPDGRFLLSAGETSGRLAVSRIDLESGRLSPVHTEDIGPMLWWVQIPAKQDAQ
jgi:6-phosphogluconolactonase